MGTPQATEMGAGREVSFIDSKNVLGEISGHPLGGTLNHNHLQGTPLSLDDLSGAFSKGYKRVEAAMQIPGTTETVFTFAEISEPEVGNNYFWGNLALDIDTKLILRPDDKDNGNASGWGKRYGLKQLNSNDFVIRTGKSVKITVGIEGIEEDADKVAMISAYGKVGESHPGRIRTEAGKEARELQKKIDKMQKFRFREDPLS
jgi:hypothetical protein